jgi:hypothetical protein
MTSSRKSAVGLALVDDEEITVISDMNAVTLSANGAMRGTKCERGILLY